MSQDNVVMSPCPFCGHVSQDMRDALHPSGTVWLQTNGRIHYASRHRAYAIPHELLGDVWEMNCLEHEGGCGASISANSREAVIIKWNRRLTLYK